MAILESTAFLTGVSSFTTALIERDEFIFGDQHLGRLIQGASFLFKEKLSRVELIERISSAYSQLRDKENLWKMRITHFKYGEDQWGELITFKPFHFDGPSSINDLSFTKLEAQSIFKDAGVKVGSYAESFSRIGGLNDDTLFFDTEENITESPVSNILLYHRENLRWETPQARGKILKGFGLSVGLQGLNFIEKSISIKNTSEYSAGVLVNSLRGPRMILSLNGRKLTESKDKFREVQQCYNESKKNWSIKL